jgi:putative chitinase
MTMLITVAALIAAGIGPAQARQFSQPLAVACQRFEINTPARIGAFIGQCRVESAGFTMLEESLFYRQPERIRAIFPSRVPDLMTAQLYVRQPERLANLVYANRLGNGDTASGDGWRYRGRGLKQLTGRDNYAAAQEALGVQYLQRPELVALPGDACLTAAWFWHTNKCNVLADSAQWDAITRVVNGPGMVARAERRAYTEQAVEALLA